MGIDDTQKIVYIMWTALILYILLHNFLKVSCDKNYMKMNKYALKNKWFTVTCIGNYSQLIWLYFKDKHRYRNMAHIVNYNVSLSDKKLLVPGVFLSAIKGNLTVNVTNALCDYSRTFKCQHNNAASGHLSTNPSVQTLTIIDNTHNVSLTFNQQNCTRSDIKCEACTVPEVDFIAEANNEIQLSCSSMMSFPTNVTNPYRFQWSIDYDNSGTYEEILRGINTSIPLSNNSSSRTEGKCLPLQYETSMYTVRTYSVPPSFTVKCKVVLEMEQIYEIKETAKRVCVCQKNETDKIIITYEKDKCNESDIHCKKCLQPEVDGMKMFGKSFNVSCTALMPFLGGHKTHNEFHWYIRHSKNKKYTQISQDFTNANPSIDNATDALHPQCVSLFNKTSVLTYKPSMWKSKIVTFRCLVSLGIDNDLKHKESTVQVCLYERGVKKSRQGNYFPIYTSVPAVVMVIVLAVLVVVAFKHRKKKSKLNQEQKRGTESDTKASADSHKISPSHTTHDYDASKKTNNKKYTYKPEALKTQETRPDNDPDKATLKTKSERKTSKDYNRSTKTKQSNLKKLKKKSTSKSSKAKDGDEYQA